MKRNRLRRLSFEQRQMRAGYLFILPLIVGVLFFFLPNMVQSFRLSVSHISLPTGGGRYTLSAAGFQHYITALTEDSFFTRKAVESILKMAVNVPTVLIFSLFIATLLNQKFKGRIVARTIFFIPVILSTGIVGLIDSWDLGYYMGTGSMNDALSSAQSLDFNALLSSLNFSPQLMEIVVGAADGIYDVVQSSGMQIFIFLAAFQEIPEALYEAARVEGCTNWEVFWKITIPLVSPQIVVNAVYTLVDSFTQADNELFTYIQELAFSQNQYPLATSMYLIYLVGLGLALALVGWGLSRFLKKST